MARVLHLFRAPKRRAPMEELETAHVLENVGFEGCAHSRPNGTRQVLLVDAETLRKMELRPGSIRENITTEGLDVNALRLGEKVHVGEVQLVVSAVCEPCQQMEELRPGITGSDSGTTRDAVQSALGRKFATGRRDPDRN